MTTRRNQAVRHIVTIELPQPTPSLNQTRGEHWGRKTRRRNSYQRFLTMTTRQAHKSGPARRLVTITRFGPRELDTDNLIGGAKTLLDAMKRAGLIWDDSPEYVEVIYQQQRSSRKEARTVITVKAPG
jgi:Holliday junction resolvase RusA-like endonuclease